MIRCVTTALLLCAGLAAQPFRWYSVEQVNIRGGAYGMDIADVDRDGDLDVGWAGNIHLNDGGGHFVEYGLFNGGTAYPSAVAFGDVDGDGDLDLVRALWSLPPAQPVWLMLNDGAGRYDAAPPGWFSGPPVITELSVALFDADGDGDLDCVLGPGQLPLRYMENDGSGRFTDVSHRMPAVPALAVDLLVADFDRDGDLDLLSGNGDGFAQADVLYVNRGDGTFDLGSFPGVADHTSRLAGGDVDGDGDLDVVVGGLVQDRLYLNDGLGGFIDASHLLPVGIRQTGCLMLADVDGDGDLDVVRGTGSGDFDIYANDGSGRFTVATGQLIANRGSSGHYMDCAWGDFDGDGDGDILAIGSGIATPRWGLMLSNGLRHVAPARSLAVGLSSHYQLSGRPGNLMLPALSTPLTRPVRLPGLGVWGLDPAAFAPLPPIRIPAGGTYDWPFTIPNAPVLRGAWLSMQALDVPPAGAPHLTRFTLDDIR